MNTAKEILGRQRVDSEQLKLSDIDEFIEASEKQKETLEKAESARVRSEIQSSGRELFQELNDFVSIDDIEEYDKRVVRKHEAYYNQNPFKRLISEATGKNMGPKETFLSGTVTHSVSPEGFEGEIFVTVEVSSSGLSEDELMAGGERRQDYAISVRPNAEEKKQFILGIYGVKESGTEKPHGHLTYTDKVYTDEGYDDSGSEVLIPMPTDPKLIETIKGLVEVFDEVNT